MKVTAELREALQALLEDCAECWPGEDVQHLLAEALWANVVREAIWEQVDWLAEKGEG